MTTQLVLEPAVRTWTDVSDAIVAAISDLDTGQVSEVRVAAPSGGQRIVAAPIGGGQIRLAAAGNDTLVGGERLTVRDERAVIAVGFSVASHSWGTFYWDWSAPIVAEHVASGIIRTLRDIYKLDAADVELTVTL